MDRPQIDFFAQGLSALWEQHLQRGDRAGALPPELPLGPAEEMRAAAGTAGAAGQPRPIGYQPERHRAQLTPWQSGSGAQGPRGTQPQQWRGWQEARGAGREPTFPPLRRPPPAPLAIPRLRPYGPVLGGGQRSEEPRLEPQGRPPHGALQLRPKWGYGRGGRGGRSPGHWQDHRQRHASAGSTDSKGARLDNSHRGRRSRSRSRAGRGSGSGEQRREDRQRWGADHDRGDRDHRLDLRPQHGPARLRLGDYQTKASPQGRGGSRHPAGQPPRSSQRRTQGKGGFPHTGRAGPGGSPRRKSGSAAPPADAGRGRGGGSRRKHHELGRRDAGSHSGERAGPGGREGSVDGDASRRPQPHAEAGRGRHLARERRVQARMAKAGREAARPQKFKRGGGQTLPGAAASRPNTPESDRRQRHLSVSASEDDS